jgi:hypothetical protein
LKPILAYTYYLNVDEHEEDSCDSEEHADPDLLFGEADDFDTHEEYFDDGAETPEEELLDFYI